MRNLKSFRFFWHLWHPWGWLSSGDIWFELENGSKSQCVNAFIKYVCNALKKWLIHMTDCNKFSRTDGTGRGHGWHWTPQLLALIKIFFLKWLCLYYWPLQNWSNFLRPCFFYCCWGIYWLYVDLVITYIKSILGCTLDTSRLHWQWFY